MSFSKFFNNAGSIKSSVEELYGYFEVSGSGNILDLYLGYSGKGGALPSYVKQSASIPGTYTREDSVPSKLLAKEETLPLGEFDRGVQAAYFMAALIDGNLNEFAKGQDKLPPNLQTMLKIDENTFKDLRERLGIDSWTDAQKDAAIIMVAINDITKNIDLCNATGKKDHDEALSEILTSPEQFISDFPNLGFLIDLKNKNPETFKWVQAMAQINAINAASLAQGETPTISDLIKFNNVVAGFKEKKFSQDEINRLVQLSTAEKVCDIAGTNGFTKAASSYVKPVDASFSAVYKLQSSIANAQNPKNVTAAYLQSKVDEYKESSIGLFSVEESVSASSGTQLNAQDVALSRLIMHVRGDTKGFAEAWNLVSEVAKGILIRELGEVEIKGDRAAVWMQYSPDFLQKASATGNPHIFAIAIETYAEVLNKARDKAEQLGLKAPEALMIDGNLFAKYLGTLLPKELPAGIEKDLRKKLAGGVIDSDLVVRGLYDVVKQEHKDAKGTIFVGAGGSSDTQTANRNNAKSKAPIYANFHVDSKQDEENLNKFTDKVVSVTINGAEFSLRRINKDSSAPYAEGTKSHKMFTKIEGAVNSPVYLICGPRDANPYEAKEFHEKLKEFFTEMEITGARLFDTGGDIIENFSAKESHDTGSVGGDGKSVAYIGGALGLNNSVISIAGLGIDNQTTGEQLTALQGALSVDGEVKKEYPSADYYRNQLRTSVKQAGLLGDKSKTTTQLANLGSFLHLERDNDGKPTTASFEAIKSLINGKTTPEDYLKNTQKITNPELVEEGKSFLTGLLEEGRLKIEGNKVFYKTANRERSGKDNSQLLPLDTLLTEYSLRADSKLYQSVIEFHIKEKAESFIRDHKNSPQELNNASVSSLVVAASKGVSASM